MSEKPNATTLPPKRGGVASLDMDQISLEQALRDFEVANARVVDLTQRVISLTQELQDVQDEVQRLRLEARSARAEAEEIKRSRAYTVARQLGELRALIRR